MYRTAGSSSERDGGCPEAGPRDGGQVRVQGRLHAEGTQHDAVLLRQLDRNDALVQRRLENEFQISN